MLAHTDNPAEVGMHVFDRAGLGKPPYKFIGFVTKKYQACQGAPVQPGACCDYCGQGIMYVCQLESADKKHFEVGCDCIRRAGDAGLLRAYKNRPEVRAMNRAKAADRDQRVIAEWNAIMADDAAKQKLWAKEVPSYRGGMEPWGAFALRAWSYCGASGRARYLKAAKALLAESGDRTVITPLS